MVTRFAPVALAAALLLASCGPGSSSGAQRAYSLNREPMVSCRVAGLDYWCGSLTVAENPSLPSGRSIQVQVDMLPAKSASNVGPPVFFLSGGPGGAATTDWASAPSVFAGLNLHHDIVLVDQRGTGRSHLLVVPDRLPGESIPAYAARALASIDGDPRFYTTSVAMEDIDAVRKALGYERIDLYGGSYGATAVQYYMKQHGENVAAAVLAGGTLLDVPIFERIAGNSQRALDDTLERCLGETACHAAFPDIKAEFAALRERLARSAVKTDALDPATGQPIVVTGTYFASAIHKALLDSRNAATIPWMVHRAAGGNFVDVAIAGSASPAATLVMSLMIRCSESWARFNPAQVTSTGGASYFLAAQLGAAQTQASACALLPPGMVRDNDAAPLRTTTPVLLLNGAEDPQDPPSNVGTAKLDMPNSVSLTVPGQGHTVANIGCLRSVVVDFFDVSRVDVDRAQSCAQSVVTPPFKLT